MMLRKIRLKGTTWRVVKGDYDGDAEVAYDQIQAFCDNHHVVVDGWGPRTEYYVDNMRFEYIGSDVDSSITPLLRRIQKYTANEQLIQQFCSEHKVELCRSNQQLYCLYIDNYNYGVLDPKELTIDVIVSFISKPLAEDKKEDKSTLRTSDELVFINDWRQIYTTVRKARYSRAASSSNENKGSSPAAIPLHSHPSTQFSSVRHRNLPSPQESQEHRSDEDNDNPCPQFLRKACTFL